MRALVYHSSHDVKVDTVADPILHEPNDIIRTGQTHVQRFMPELLQSIEAGKLKPEVIISHRLPLDRAAEGYRMFDKKEDDCRKVV